MDKPHWCRRSAIGAADVDIGIVETRCRRGLLCLAAGFRRGCRPALGGGFERNHRLLGVSTRSGWAVRNFDQVRDEEFERRELWFPSMFLSPGFFGGQRRVQSVDSRRWKPSFA